MNFGREKKRADIVILNNNAPRQVIEVETIDTINDDARQLQGYQRPVYVAGADDAATEAALEHYDGTTIGVMDPSGKS